MRRAFLFVLAIAVGGSGSVVEAQQRRPRTPPRPTRPDTTRRPAPTTRPAARRPAPPPDERTVGVVAGGAMATLDFGLGPVVGANVRYRKGRWPIALRGEALFSRFSQTPTLGGVASTTDATLSHFGVAAGAEYPLGLPRQAAPYIFVTSGVFRFAGSGPAGDASDVPAGVFTGTTDVALSAGLGARFRRHFFAEARLLTVGDFHMVPVTIGYQFNLGGGR